MEKGLGLLSTEVSVAPKADPRLRLLMELEPAHEVFFSNLADAISRRTPPPLKLASPPAAFWHDVFVPTELPWKSFQESLLWHMVVLIAAWSISQGWASRPKPHVSQSFRASESVYYSPSKIYPSTHSTPPRTQAHAKGHSASAASRGQKAMPVAAEHRGTPKLIVPPDLKLAEGPRAPNLPADPTLPSVPLSATTRANQAPVSGLNGVVAPPPDVSGRTKGLAGLPQSAVVAPPVDAKGIAGDRALRGPGSASVIAPPPGLQGTSRGVRNLGAGNAEVVAPPPTLQGQALRAGSGRGPRGLGASAGGVVPPPPSVEHSGRAGSLTGPGVAVVPPPPSMQGAGIGGGNGRGTSTSGVGAAVVPPPPSVQSGGGGLFATLSSWFSNSPSKIVPPPPGLQGAGGGTGGGSGRVGSLSGGGSDVVPPPPSMQGGGNGRGRVTSLASGGSDVVPPPPAVQGSGGGSGTRSGFGNSLSGGGAGVVPPPPSLSGTGSGRGTGVRGGGALSAGGTDVVPPPPSIAGGNGSGTGASGAGSRLGSLAGGGGSVVPPPPSIAGSGAGGSGNRVGSLGAGSGNVVAPPPSVGGGGGSVGRSIASAGAPGGGMHADPPPAPVGAGSVSTGPLEQMDPLPDVPETAQAPSTPDVATAPGEDVPLRLVGVPIASSKTSFFSGYEVFLAERRLDHGQTELIKLVYVFLPYQKRLSEYDWNTIRIYKLRVVQDPTCEESLMQMMWPEGEDQGDPETQAEANKLATKVSDKNTRLHCFRTTADAFQRAISHAQ